MNVGTVFDNYIADIEVDGRHTELALWDVSGVEDYDRLRPLSDPDSHVVLICFNSGNPDSMDNVYEKWLPEISNFCAQLAVVLVGYRSERRHDPRTIEDFHKMNKHPLTHEEEGEEMRDALGALTYLEYSARTGEGVREVFQVATRAALHAPSGNKSKRRSLLRWSRPS